MQNAEIKIGSEYAVKWDLSEKGKLPMAVFRARVTAKGTTHIVRKYSSYTRFHEKHTVANCIDFEILEVFNDPRWTRGGVRGEATWGRGPRRERVKIGQVVFAENGAPFVSPWPDYLGERNLIEHAVAEEEALKWERQQNRAQIAERLQRLGFSVRKHAAPWREGFVEQADYTIEGGILTPAALDKLVGMVEDASG